MPLALPVLKSQLEALFAAPGATVADCAQGWSDAVQAYAGSVVPASTTVAAAAAALTAALTSAFAAPAAAPGMETAFAAFAASVGLGMAGFTPIPPPAPVGFAVQFAGPKPQTHHDAAEAIGDLINTWMTTGTATLIAPPNTVVPWS
jgi:hypothetical protein